VFFSNFKKKIYWSLKFIGGFEIDAKSPANSMFFSGGFKSPQIPQFEFFPTSLSGGFKLPQMFFL
jgi:hypothetical protein